MPNEVKSIYFMNNDYGFWFYDELKILKEESIYTKELYNTPL